MLKLKFIPLVVLTAAVAGCNDNPVALQNASSVEVVLDVFSGLPNPEWSLSSSQVAELKTKLADLPSVSPPTTELGLGYRGFLLRDTTDRETETRVFAGRIIVTESGRTRYYRDAHGLEAWLQVRARERGYGNIIDRG